MSGKAIFPGSFDPFTNGHLDMVRKGAKLFDEVIVIIGVNTAKKRRFPAEDMKAALEKTFADEGLTNCRVCIYDGLVAAFAEQYGAEYMMRGLRNPADFAYEESNAEVNKIINPNLEYVYFRADQASLSSSMIRELMAFGRDVSQFLPAAVAECIK